MEVSVAAFESPRLAFLELLRSILPRAHLLSFPRIRWFRPRMGQRGVGDQRADARGKGVATCGNGIRPVDDELFRREMSWHSFGEQNRTSSEDDAGSGATQEADSYRPGAWGQGDRVL
jgi:hypothetical protein